MTRFNILQTDFTSGELDPRLLGRTDLRTYENGAARLENIVVETTGGAKRRPGTAYIATAAGRGRLIAFEPGSGGEYLLVITDQQVNIFENNGLVSTLTTPWSEADISQLVWGELDESIIITHQDHPPQQITKITSLNWTIADLAFAEKEGGFLCAPFARFADPAVTLAASGTAAIIVLSSSDALFQSEHIGTVFRIGLEQFEITSIITPTEASGQALDLSLAPTDQIDITATTDWDEQAFSDVRGYPIAVSFHQNRMVLGGSRALQNTLWLSKSGQFFNFDLGTGLDDEAIAFRLAANEAQAIRSLVSGRHLQVFTSVGEWIVTGTPLTPVNIQLRRQSRIGSPVDRHVPPRDVDGATLFASRNGREIREFLFTDSEQAYEAPDLALLASHLVVDPVDQAFDRGRRLFLIAMTDGSIASIGIYRNADIVAWSKLATDGAVISIATSDKKTFLLVQRSNGVFIEEFADDLFADSAVSMSEANPTTTWTGLSHLDGKTVAVVADGAVVDDALVSGGQITLSSPANDVTVGLPYTHIVEPLPPAFSSARGKTQEPLYRPVRLVFRVFETSSLAVDTGNGSRDLLFFAAGTGPSNPEPTPFSGDQILRALGWRRGPDVPPWRIEQSRPLPFTLLSATTEIKVIS